MTEDYDGLDPRDLDEAIAHCGPALESLRGANLFITGGTGFFGRWLLATIARAHRQFGIRATALTRNPQAFRAAYPALADHAAISLAHGDVRYFEFPKGRFSHVVHAATDTSVAADSDSATLIDTIVSGTARVLEFAATARAERLLYVSSGAVYGPQPTDIDVIDEDYRGAPDPCDPRSAYGQAKRVAEQMCVCAMAKGALQPVIARAFAFVGPGLPLDAHFAIGNFIGDAVAGRDVVVAGDGSPLRSYLYAGDLAAWLLTLLAKGRAGAAYNVGSDEPIAIGDLARKAAHHAADGRRAIIKGEANANAARSRYIPSIARARALGLDVWTSLDSAILKTVDHARARSHSPAPSPALHRNEHASDARLTFVVDVDGVVASLTPGNDYTLAEPLEQAIAAVNELFDQGHRIVMFTARGSATGMDWRKVTEDQFARWGLRYHELHFGKPAADFYIDDRLLPVSALASLARRAG